MGSSSSKPSSSSSSRTGNGKTTSAHKARSKANSFFHSSCLRLATSSSSGSHRSLNHHHRHHDKQTGDETPCTNQTETENNQAKINCYRKDKIEQSDVMPCISSDVQLNEWGQTSINSTVSRTDSTSDHASSTQSLNPSSRFLSRFSVIPGNLSFRLSRATSLGSSRAYPVSSPSIDILNNEEDHQCARANSSVLSRYEAQRPNNLLPGPLTDRTSSQRYEDTSTYFQLSTPASGSSDNLRDNQTASSVYGVARNGDSSTGMGTDVNLSSPGTHSAVENIDTRIYDRRTGGREPIERNVRFSRTLSVGRLRDRVLRRSSSSDLTFCPLQQDREVRDASQGYGRQTWGVGGEAPAFESNAGISPTRSAYSPSSISNSMFGIQDYEAATSRAREGRYYDLLEHRSNFLERRRRIRSQVRALQRLGSRFENLSGHERSCIISGQHRTGRCTCRTANRDANSNDDTSARASISRIVMLAEALFEVLDEIHQQSVVLSSRPSASSIGSVPAPNEVVDSLPVKLYTKLQKHHNEEAAQCYICLVEYEEGDSMRTLPCHHEFHRTCVDKWLKEIHRVCPLCRGDICRPDLLPAET